MIFVVWREEQDSTTGIAFTGIFDNRNAADSFAVSEGPEYKVSEIPFGPIDWQKIVPLPEIDWNDLPWR